MAASFRAILAVRTGGGEPAGAEIKPSGPTAHRPKTSVNRSAGPRTPKRVDPDVIPDSPFGPFAPRESFLETLAVGAALARLIEGLGAREPFLLVTGDPGTGKTAVAHEAIDRWGSRVTT